MNRLNLGLSQICGVGILILLILPMSVSAGIELKWDKHWHQVLPGQDSSLSLVLSDTVALRTIEVRIEYNPLLISGAGIEPGDVFSDVPCSLFEVYEDDSPNVWHGFFVIMGGACQTTGPGQLLTWNFSARDTNGVSAISTVEVVLFAPDATRIPGVTLVPSYVAVGEQETNVPALLPQPILSLAPNPFNPRTNIVIQLANGSAVTNGTLEVYDLRGRCYGEIWRGTLSGNVLEVPWDGRSVTGAALPSGVYVFKLSGPQFATVTTRGVLLR